MKYYIYGFTSTGNYRKHNEDSILIDHDVFNSGSHSASVAAPFITAVGDGVGGENAGELASELCLKHLAMVDYSSNVNMSKTVLNIHKKIKKKGVTETAAANMQTTLCCLSIDENGDGLCVNVGDSRMYRYVNSTVRQISVDQSYGQFLYEHGSIDDMDELTPELQNAIVSSVGSVLNDPVVDQIPLVTKFGTEPDDMIIIVSDGISDILTEEQIEVGLSLDLPISQKLEALAQLAIEDGSTDNVSIIGIKPYMSDIELEALTTEAIIEKSVNIEEILEETDKLGEILNIDINEIISDKNSNSDYFSDDYNFAQDRSFEHKNEPVTVAEDNETHNTEKPVESEKTEEAVIADVPEESVNLDEAAEKTESDVTYEYTENVKIDTGIDVSDILAEYADIAARQSESIGTDENGVRIASSTSNDDNDYLSHGAKKRDLGFETLELTHQSASSLARLEQKFGKNKK